ncbi:MAG: glycoside hydrolase family 3 C-terminal domain-containing protein [Flavobacteriaceae bacterium]|nr:glycoside hydrolase family 3 C-terminal domain-containing protein [Flavobacteriaceae bacterium]
MKEQIYKDKKIFLYNSILFFFTLYFLFSTVNSLAQKVSYPFQNTNLDVETRANDLLNRLTLSEKVAQMQDVSPAIERLGIDEYNWWNESLHGVARAGAATSYPQAIGMAATWNPDLIFKVADAISSEARAKFNHSIQLGQRNRYQGLTMWSPNINIFRDPRWGRGQETYGEDPFLTSRMGIAFVKGLQGNDPDYFKVIATPKHYAVHSGPEHNRHSFDAYTDKRDLWETYLPAFKATIIEGKAFSIMSAYNRYLGESATASQLLLNDILRDKWGFEGYVVSDCGAVYDIYKFHKIVPTAEEASALAVKAGCDLNCGSSYKYLVKSVKDGLITEKEIDKSLKRLIIARIKLGLFNTQDQIPFLKYDDSFIESDENKKLALQTARESIVLLKNEAQTLPISKKIKTITVIGPNANDRHFLLGNYFGTPTTIKTILEGIKDKVSKKTKVYYFKGTNLTDNDTIFDVIEPSAFHGKITATYFNNSKIKGNPVYSTQKEYVDFEWGGAAPIDILSPGKFSVRYTGELKTDFTGDVLLGVLESGGSYRLFIDDKEVLKGESGNRALSTKIHLQKNKKYSFKLEYLCTNEWMASIQLVWNREQLKGRDYMIQKVKESDVVIYVGGITARLEGEEMPIKIEGFDKGDRTNLKLPKVQHELLQELNKTGTPVVFALTGGSAMAINWEQENLDAILNIWYPGQGGGDAVADILFGDYNPSGKLPLTYYKTINDLPPFEDYHMKGRTYRFFEGDVLYPFGYGLSYTHFNFSKPILEKLVIGKNDNTKISITISNDGNFDGETVVQLYVNDVKASVTTPIKTLRKFKKVFLKKGESKNVAFKLSPKDLFIFDKNGDSFVEAGQFEIYIGKNSGTTNKAILTVK